jgi:hypothetical protein
MEQKEKKTTSELQAMIMQEVQKHPDWSDIEDVAIKQSGQTAPHRPNWSVGFVTDGPRMASAAAFQFARELGAKFDLA